MIEKYLPAWAQEKIAEMIEAEIEAKGLRDDEFFTANVETEPSVLGEIFFVSVAGQARFDGDGEIESVYFDSVSVGRGYSFDECGDLYKDKTLLWEEKKEFQKLF